MSTVRVRPYEPMDASALARIYAPYVTGTTVTFEVETPQAGELAQRFAGLVETGHPVLVAEDQGQVVGYAYAGSFRARAAYRHTVEHSVYVDEGVQRKGVGRVLMRALIIECRDRGFREMVGVIADADGNASIPFHEKLGFRHAGRLERVGVKFGRVLGITLLQRSTVG